MRRLFIILGLALLLTMVLATPLMAAQAVKVNLTPLNGAKGTAVLTLKFGKLDVANDNTADLTVKLSLKNSVPDASYWVFVKVDGGPAFLLGKISTSHKGNGRFQDATAINNLSNPLNRTIAVSICATNTPADMLFSTLGFITVPLK